MKDNLLALFKTQQLSDVEKSKCNMVISRLQKMVDQRYGLKGEVFCEHYYDDVEDVTCIYFCASFNGLIEDHFLCVKVDDFDLFDEYYIDASEFPLFKIDSPVSTIDVENTVLNDSIQYNDITGTVIACDKVEKVFKLLYPGATYNVHGFTEEQHYRVYRNSSILLNKYYVFDKSEKLVLIYIDDYVMLSKLYLTDNAEVLQEFKSASSRYITSAMAIDIIDNSMDLNILL